MTPLPRRRKRLARVACVAASLCVWIGLASSPVQGQRLNIRRYSLDDDVPGGQIYAIHRDARGYIWLASNAGLGRYDGRGFHASTAGDGLASNSVTLLDGRPGGPVVAGTQSGVCWVRPGRIGCVGVADGLVPEQLRDLHLDEDGAIWVAADGGVSLIREGRVARSFTEADGLPARSVGSIVRDAEGILWAGTQLGLARLEGDRWVPVALPPSAGAFVGVLEVSPGGLLVGTSEGLFVRGREGWRQIPVRPGPGGVRLLSHGPDGTLWVGSLRTLHAVTDGGIRTYTAMHGLPVHDFWDMEVDLEGNVWIGSDEGLAKIVPGPFDLFTEAQGLPHPFVRAMALTKGGALWMGTRQGLARWNGDRFVPLPLAGPDRDERVYSLAGDPAGGLLIGTAEGLIHRSDNGALLSVGTDEGLPHDFVLALLPDGGDGIWVGTAGGVAHWKDGGLAPARWPALAGAQVLSLARDAGERLWVGLASGGLLVADGDDVRALGPEEGISDQSVWSMAPDRQGGMWVGTNGDGAYYVAGDSIRRLTRADGLGDDFVWQVAVDSRGDVWFFTGNGLNRLHDGVMTYFGTADGLTDLEGTAAAVIEDTTGALWFGAGSGVYRYRPGADRQLPDLPPVAVEAVTVGGVQVPFSSLVFPPRPGAIEFRFSVPSYSNEEGIRFRYRFGGTGEGWSAASSDPTVGFARLGPGRYTLEVTAETDRGRRSSQILPVTFTVQAALWETWWFKGIGLVLLTLALSRVPALHARRLEAERKRLEAVVGERTQVLQEKSLRLELEIEERENTERARKELQAQLWEAQKMEAVGRLAGGVAHDFNNMLAVVQGQAELLAQDAEPGSEARAALDEILTSASRGADLVSRLLAFSQKQLLRWERLDLCHVVRDNVDVLRSMLDARIELLADIPVTPLHVDGDRSQLSQVLVNLVLNAMAAMPSGGQIRVEVRSVERDQPTRSSLGQSVPAGPYVRLRVADSGVGMDAETLERAFEPFFTTRPVGEGTGLGLSTVHGIVEMHRGFLYVRSAPGQGTEFKILFPHMGEDPSGPPQGQGG